MVLPFPPTLLGGSCPTSSHGFCRLGLPPSEKALPTGLQKQSIKATSGQPVGKADQLAMAGSSSICCLRTSGGHSSLEAVVLRLCCIPPDGIILYLENDAATVGPALICFCSEPRNQHLPVLGITFKGIKPTLPTVHKDQGVPIIF